MTIINNGGFTWTLEKGTVRHKIALQCLISKGDDPKHKDYELFYGDIMLCSLYIDMCNANIKEIHKEDKQRLKM